MGALLKDDIIISLSGGDVKVGTLPKGVGLERLRWDGSKLVDLIDLKEMYVVFYHPDIFELHAVEVKGSQLVTMTYADRKRLINDNGTIRLLTEAEELERASLYQKQILKANTREVMTASLGDINDQIADLTKMIFMGIIGLRTQDKAILDIIDACLPDMAATYDMTKVGASLATRIKTLKALMQSYYSEQGKIGTAA